MDQTKDIDVLHFQLILVNNCNILILLCLEKVMACALVQEQQIQFVGEGKTYISYFCNVVINFLD